MGYIYKGFTGNDGSTTYDPVNGWDAIEVQERKDIEDTLVVGTIQGAKDVGGHKHASLFHDVSHKGVECQELTFMGGQSLIQISTKDSAGTYQVLDIGASSSGDIQIMTGAEIDLNLNVGASCIYLTCAKLIVHTLPTSSSGLASGTLWNSGGNVKVV